MNNPQFHRLHFSDPRGRLVWLSSHCVFSPACYGRHSSSSSKRWTTRQTKDKFAKEARVQGLKSRAAFKLLEINEKYRIFKRGQTVVDLGYAPGSWSQVAVDRTSPNGRVLGIDIIPAQPPTGVSTIQGNFLSPTVRASVQDFLTDPDRGRPRSPSIFSPADSGDDAEPTISNDDRGYIDLERYADDRDDLGSEDMNNVRMSNKERERLEGKTVDVVLSDMSAPWDQTSGFWKKSLSNPYFRMQNTSGTSFRDHAGSMDLCLAALEFCFDTLRKNGHFVCKFYQGSEDKALETRLKRLFRAVHREKPESSRSESKEAYFVALRRKDNVDRGTVLNID